jgi:hypothetical protein
VQGCSSNPCTLSHSTLCLINAVRGNEKRTDKNWSHQLKKF